MKGTLLVLAVAGSAILTMHGMALGGSVITGVWIPQDSMDSACHALIDDVWSVRAPPYPLDINMGIGFIVNPSFDDEFSLHDHVYTPPGSHTPDPSRAVVTYQFDEPVVVDQIEVIQHVNGVTLIEGFVGDSLASLTSIGSVFGPYGDIEGLPLREYESHVFDFDNLTEGRFFQFIIRKTSASGGYATHQVFPRNAQGIRFPAAYPGLRGDANGDGCVNGADYTIWADHYDDYGGWTEGDFNLNGYVSGDDYTIWADHYREGCGGAAIPEPAALSLLALAGMVLTRRRK